MGKPKLSICWLRRDLRLNDNTALFNALQSRHPVLLLFIFDTDILIDLPKDDKRVLFIHKSLEALNHKLAKVHTSVLVEKGKPLDVFKNLMNKYDIKCVYCNKDYEPYGMARDKEITTFLKSSGTPLFSFKDIVVFEENEIVKSDGAPYTVFTPYSKKWLMKLAESPPFIFDAVDFSGRFFSEERFVLPTLDDLGFTSEKYSFPPAVFDAALIKPYEQTRDYPALDATTRLGIHLRFGTISIREAVLFAQNNSKVWLNELIWREFFMMILFHFPYVANKPFKKRYDNLEWVNDTVLFERWCSGTTGYPFVDAGMRQLVSTGFMHNRLRMITAGFLVKHLLIDWRWGEAFFAKHLLDFELSSNNGNWQWAAGTGCDAAPYFRIFNPDTQMKKFDKAYLYVKKWVPELGTNANPKPIVVHEDARKKALAAFRGVV